MTSSLNNIYVPNRYVYDTINLLYNMTVVHYRRLVHYNTYLDFDL